MTLVFAWLRQTGEVEELIVASDSRLSGGGERWDGCPKIMGLPRGDAFLAFAGHTWIAYPALLQIQSAILAHPDMAERRYDISQASNTVLAVLNQMQSARDLSEHPSPQDEEKSLSETTFLLGGYSWRQAKFGIWKYQYDNYTRAYKKVPRGTQLTAIGDVASTGSYLLNQQVDANEGYNMEPFEVLRDMLRSKNYDSIGGAPQIAKVYRHLNCDQFGVIWRSEQGAPKEIVCIGGRPLLQWEKAFFPLIDADDPTHHARASREKSDPALPDPDMLLD